MEKLKNNKLFLFAFFGVLLLLCLVFIFSLFNKDESSDSDGKSASDLPLEEPMHEHHNDENSDYNKDPFIETGKEEVEISKGLVFSKPTLLSYATKKHTSPTYVGHNNQLVAFINYGGFLRFFDSNGPTRYEDNVLDNEVTHFTFCDDESYGFYVKSYPALSEFYFFDANFYRMEQLFVSDGIKINSISCSNNIFFYDYVNLDGEDVTETYLHPTIMSNSEKYYSQRIRENFVSSAKNIVTKSDKNDLIVYNSKNQSIEILNTDLSTTHLANLASVDDLKEMIDISYVNQNQYFYFYLTNKGNTNFIINGKTVPKFNMAEKAIWIDPNHLLLNNEGILYIYNTENENIEILVTNVRDFFVLQEDVYYTLGDDLYIMKKK